MPRFPSSVAELTPELLTEVLAELHPGVVVEDVRVVETSQCGDGFASTADRVALEFAFASGCDAGVPTRALIKTMLLAPHAPPAMYQTEVRFYREIRPQLDIETPQVFASVFDEESAQFGVIMEDLGLRSVRFPNATTPVSVAELTSVVDTLAALHAKFWQSPRFDGDLRWLATPRSGGMYPVFDTYGLEFITDQVEKNEFKADLIAPLGRTLPELWEELWKLQALLDSEPVTLLHGDPHIANTYLVPRGAARENAASAGGLLDWQLMVRGRWSHDLTYLIVTGLDIELRRKYEREIIAHYLDALRSRGVENAPTADEAWLLYRQSVVWGLVIGWLITPPENYGVPITVANLTRLVTAFQDLETITALAGA